MKRTCIIGVAALAMALAGCSKHDNDTLDTWNGEILLSSGVTGQTRANSVDVPDKQIAEGQKVYAYVDDATANTSLYASYELDAVGDGTFTYDAMRYPATGNNVNIYVIHSSEAQTGAFPTSAITHTVNSDQSDQHGVNYLTSDLLYAVQKGVARTKEDVNLTFYHMLSKVEVALKAGAGSPDLAGAVVTIENTKVQVPFTPSKTADINSSDPTTAEAARAGLLGTTEGGITPIKIGTQVSNNNFGTGTIYASAVVVPQTVAQNRRFIKVTLASGGELYYTIPDEEGLTLKSGNKYQFKITVNLTELTVVSTITDWATNTPIDGTAELPPIGSKTKPTTAAVGDFYFNDGSLEDKDAVLTAAQRATCLGIVFKGGRDYFGEWKDDCIYYQKDGTTPMPNICGYVLALYDDNDGNYCAWGSSGTVVGTNTETTGFYGYKNTNAIKTFDAANGNNLWTNFPATYRATVGYEKNYPAPANSSGWFLPSVGQFEYWYNNKDVILASVKKATGNSYSNWKDLYLSSSEYDRYPANEVWKVSVIEGRSSPTAKSHVSYYVRSIFAF